MDVKFSLPSPHPFPGKSCARACPEGPAEINPIICLISTYFLANLIYKQTRIKHTQLKQRERDKYTESWQIKGTSRPRMCTQVKKYKGRRSLKY